VDFRFSAENATRQKKHFPEKWTSGFPPKMRPGKRSIFRKSGLPVFRRKCDQAKEAFSGKVDFRFSVENATT
jgi:hypothetical protein